MIETPENELDVWQPKEKVRKYPVSGFMRNVFHDLDSTEHALVEALCESIRIFRSTKLPFLDESLFNKLTLVS